MNAPFAKDGGGDINLFGFEQISVTSNPAVGFTAATMATAKAAYIVCETAAVRYRLDGVSPTVSVGTLLGVGGTLVVWGGVNMLRFKAIAVSGTATLDVHYGR